MGLGKGFRVAVHEGELHAMVMAELGNGKTDSTGGTGDQGGVACFEDGM